MPAPLVAALVAALVGGIAVALVVSGLGRPTAGDDATRSGAPAAPAAGDAPGSAGLRGGATWASATSALLHDLRRVLDGSDDAALRTLTGPPAARRLAAAVVRNVTRLGVEGLALRRVAEAPATADLVRRFGAGTWVADVQVSWRYAGVDDRPVTSTAQLVLSPRAGSAVLDDTRPALGEQAPTWLLGPLALQRGERVLVTAPDPATAARLATQAARAVAVVGRRLPGWRGDLVVEVPESAAGFRAATGLGPAASRSIAAVTTTADGSTLPGNPERVFVNPRVFGPLGAAGQQVVLNHEATHVAVDAAVRPLPAWLSEGFADWVALADSSLPARLLASQALEEVREHGAPRRLPGRTAFGAGSHHLGAAYESAWLAVRLLALTHGEAAVLRFRRVADRRQDVDQAFAAIGTSKEAFTRAWRRELLRLAG